LKDLGFKLLLACIIVFVIGILIFCIATNRIRVRFNWRDLWWGVYIDDKKRLVYIIPLIPTIVFIIDVEDRSVNSIKKWRDR